MGKGCALLHASKKFVVGALVVRVVGRKAAIRQPEAGQLHRQTDSLATATGDVPEICEKFLLAWHGIFFHLFNHYTKALGQFEINLDSWEAPSNTLKS